MAISNTGVIVRVSTNESTGCKGCKGFRIGGDHFEESVNHYIYEHGWKLLAMAMDC